MASDVGLATLGLGAVVLVAAIFVLDYLLERDGRQAARRTSRRFFGVSIGVVGALVLLLANLLHLVAELPGIVIGLVGLGGIMGIIDISGPEFAVVFCATYVVSAAVLMDGED